MVRVIIHGSSGRMGGVLSFMARENTDIKIVAGVDRRQSAKEFPVYSSIKDVKEEADAVIDFSNADAIDELLDVCVEKKLPVVLCTTGLSDEQIDRVQEESKKIPILRSANMSIGINLLLGLVEEASAALKGKGYDIEIIEKHHRHKLDAPSGTAIEFAEACEDGLGEMCDFVYDRSGRREERADNEIGISAIRGGSITGEHEVIFAGVDEVISFSHTAYSREIFAKGALAAARFLVGKKPKLYTMRDVVRVR